MIFYNNYSLKEFKIQIQNGINSIATDLFVKNIYLFDEGSRYNDLINCVTNFLA